MLDRIEDEEEMNVFELLDFLSNKNRRRILELLAAEDRYPFQISRILDMSPRIIKEYLEELKNLGLISLEKRDSDKGPQRIYASLNRTFSLIIDVGQNTFDVKYLPTGIIIEKKVKQTIEKTEDEIDRERKKNILKLKKESAKIKDFIQSKITDIKELDNQRKEFIEDINEAFYRFNKTLEEIIIDFTDREILRSIFNMSITKSDNRISLSELSRIFEVRREGLRDKIESLASQIECVIIEIDKRGEIWYSI